MDWDPAQYARFSAERGRPFADLVARVAAQDPRLVVDLGCGNGPLTLGLAQRWPRARVVGVDSSAAMLEAARVLDPAGRVEWLEADLAEWDVTSLGQAPDVVLTNATLQWVPDHLSLLQRWVQALRPGGWFAMQVPANFGEPSHRLMREVARSHPAAERLLPVLGRAAVAEPSDYIEALVAPGGEVEVWETTHHHVLDPEGLVANPVLEWVRSTGLRPVLEVLADDEERRAFIDDYDARLRAAYPRRAHGVVFPFRRLFAVAQKS